VGALIPSGKAVFLSYASEDAVEAEKICGALVSAGIEVWFDKSELRGGDAWDASIRQQIKNCTLFIPVISRTIQTRDEGYSRLEWKLAVDRSHLIAEDRAFLLPVVIDETMDAAARVPDRFREVQWTRPPGGETPPAFAERVARLLTAEAAASPPAGARASGAATMRKPSLRSSSTAGRQRGLSVRHDLCAVGRPGEGAGVAGDGVATTGPRPDFAQDRSVHGSLAPGAAVSVDPAGDAVSGLIAGTKKWSGRWESKIPL